MAKENMKSRWEERRERRRHRFPVLAILLLIFGIVWLLESLGVYTINVPWMPVIVIVVAIALIYNRLNY